MLGRTAAAAAAAAAIQPDGHMPSPIAAPRPVPAQQLTPPAWMLAALPLEVLLGLAAPTYKQKIINDVFFTQEERHESPQLTPVSEIEDIRGKLLAPADDSSDDDDDDMTCNLGLSGDLALFADPREARGAWAAAEEIDTVCTSTRQPSPTPTVTSDRDHAALVSSTVELADDDDVAPTKTHSSPLSAHVAQSKSQYLR
ncbi:hypothetical protein FBU59_002970 [Linderina macrospora]|uniref:Uncharacterized protein n=1 Tax=Linderina macrospora TaxID=4868 RepID=A0ACC1J9U0_9FUNG|nr:hypothetical protein FBU59_002970 [Linderina macrospora]